MDFVDEDESEPSSYPIGLPWPCSQSSIKLQSATRGWVGWVQVSSELALLSSVHCDSICSVSRLGVKSLCREGDHGLRQLRLVVPDLAFVCNCVC